MDFSSLSGLSSASADPKTSLMRQVQQESAVQNARMLIEKLNDNCFDRCIPKPGSSLSKTEETCMTACMEKYMAAWNAVSRAYITRIQKDSAAGGAAGGML